MFASCGVLCIDCRLLFIVCWLLVCVCCVLFVVLVEVCRLLWFVVGCCDLFIV